MSPNRPPGPDPEAPDLTFLASPERPDELGRLGPYRVLKVIGRGGMGVVLLAEDVALRRSLAIKVMSPRLAADPAARERFLREARAAAALEHDHIVPIYQVGDDHGVPFIAMPVLKGMSLEDYLRDRGNLTVPQLLRVGRGVAKGLAAAHGKGLVHRDIKPANLWLDAKSGGRVRILDFGLARLVEGDGTLTQDGVVIGTPAYMSPEQAAGKPVGPASDLFSLGAVLYRLSTGRRPFTGTTTFAMLTALATETPLPVSRLNPQVPRAFSDLVMRLLSKNPSDRPSSANQVAEAIHAVERERLREKLDQEPPPGLKSVGRSNTVKLRSEDETESHLDVDTPPEPGQARTRSPRPRWFVPAAAAACAAVVVVATAVALWPRPPAPTERTLDSQSPVPPTPPRQPTPPARESMEEGWKPLFNGKDLTGWHVSDNQKKIHEPFHVVTEDGEPAMRNKDTRPAGVSLATGALFSEFHLRLQFKVASDVGYAAINYHMVSSGITHLLLNNPGTIRVALGTRLWDEAGWVGNRFVPRGEGLASSNFARNLPKPTGTWRTLDLYCVGDTAVPCIDGRPLGALVNQRDKIGTGWRPVKEGRIGITADGPPGLFVRRVTVRPITDIPSDVKARISAPGG